MRIYNMRYNETDIWYNPMNTVVKSFAWAQKTWKISYIFGMGRSQMHLSKLFLLFKFMAWPTDLTRNGLLLRLSLKSGTNKIIWATACQNQRNDLCAQRRLRSDWASAQSDQSLLCAQLVAMDPRFLHADGELWSDLADAQADLVFAGRTGHFVGFVLLRLIFCSLHTGSKTHVFVCPRVFLLLCHFDSTVKPVNQFLRQVNCN